MTAIDDFLLREIAIGSFPAAAYAVGSSNGVESEGALGLAVAVPLRIPATLDTIFDCASLTKPLVTTTLILQAVAERRISLDDRHEGYSFRELLTHTTGLRAWMPLYASDDPLRAIREEGSTAPRGSTVIYSDLNFVLLWHALREIYGDVDSAVRGRIPDAILKPDPALRPSIAATEWGQRYEAKMCAERHIAFDRFRDRLIWGDTHDGNSHHIGGGFAGNAGLFGTARSVFRIAQRLVRGELLPREVMAQATANHTAGLEDARGFGWQKPTGSDATSMLSEKAYGHTGFTGTSLWIEPQADRIMVLLTNRVHPCAAPIAMQKIRGTFHQLALGG